MAVRTGSVISIKFRIIRSVSRHSFNILRPLSPLLKRENKILQKCVPVTAHVFKIFHCLISKVFKVSGSAHLVLLSALDLYCGSRLQNMAFVYFPALRSQNVVSIICTNGQ
jgi:hypothetical protein